MEALEVELGAERLLRFGASASPGGVPDLVAARLADHRAIALDLALGAGARETSRLDHVISALFAGPALGVQAGVDDEPRGAEQKGLQETRAAERIVRIDTELVGELLGIKRPAFAICGEEAELPQLRDVLRLLRKADLQVMARYARSE